MDRTRSTISRHWVTVMAIVCVFAVAPVISQISTTTTAGTAVSNFPFNLVQPTGFTATFTDADSVLEGGIKIPQTLVSCVAIPNQATEALTSHAIWIADNAYQVTGVNAVWDTASSSGTLTIEKLTGTTGPGSGTAMLTGTISSAGTANTVTAGALTGTVGTLQLASGNRIGLVVGGTETGLTGLRVCTSLKRI